jgi:SEC-C motif-containing protein
MNEKTDLCPCGSGLEYNLCCGQFLQGKRANTAEQLMRSRYTAYVVNDETYLLETWLKNTRPQTLNFSRQQPQKWIGLKILNHAVDVDYPDEARVEFIARYKVNGKAGKIHELSRFKKQDGRWFYVDGDFRE